MPLRLTRRTIILAACVLLAACIVVCVDTAVPTVAEVTVPVPGLTRPLTILQVTDLHGARFGARQRRLARLLGTRRFSAVIMTGDLQNGPGADTRPALELVAVVRAHTRHLAFVQGNHDGALLAARLRSAGVVELGRHGASITLGPTVAGARISSADTATPRRSRARDAGVRPAIDVLVSHVPPAPGTLSARASDAPLRLYLAGHTHGGQIRLPLLGAIWAPAPEGSMPTDSIDTGELFPDLRGFFVRGLYERRGGYVNVSPGLGTFRIPVRFCDQARLDVIRLVPAR